MHRLFWLGLGLTAFVACASRHYVYTPVTTTSAEVEGRSAALAIPPESPRGELRLTTLGIARVTPPSESQTPEFRGLYVQMLVSNLSDEVWSVDQMEQRIEVEERRGSSLAVVTNYATTATGARPPTVQISPKTSMTLDLLFPLPRGWSDASELPRFDVIWTVHAGTRVFTGHVPFERQIESAPAQVPPSLYEPPPPYRMPGRYPPPPIE